MRDSRPGGGQGLGASTQPAQCRQGETEAEQHKAEMPAAGAALELWGDGLLMLMEGRPAVEPIESTEPADEDDELSEGLQIVRDRPSEVGGGRRMTGDLQPYRD